MTASVLAEGPTATTPLVLRPRRRPNQKARNAKAPTATTTPMTAPAIQAWEVVAAAGGGAGVLLVGPGGVVAVAPVVAGREVEVDDEVDDEEVGGAVGTISR